MSLVHNNIPATLLVADTAVGLSSWGFTAAQIAGAVSLTITTDEPVRYLTTGTPTATYGHILQANTTSELQDDVASIQFIRESATSANITLELDTFYEA